MYYTQFDALGVVVKGTRKAQKVKCPNCVREGKTNINDTCLSINLETGLYNCHKCSWRGCVAERTEKVQELKVEYKLPEKKNLTKLSQEVVDWFDKRKIPQAVLLANKIVMTKDGRGVVFPYLRDGTMINYKSRSIAEKKFYQATDAEHIMFNYDRIKTSQKIIVCEGEFDSLSWEVAGYEYHTTVSQGAPNVNDSNVDKKLECITNSFDAFEQAEVIYIAVDNDANGKRLEKELIRRFGAEKCKTVDFGECKDANEFLIKYDAFELSQLLSKAKDVQIEGVLTVSDNYDSLMYEFKYGQNRGETTHIEEIDKVWKWRRSDLNVWTGYQNEGKSLKLNQLSLIKAFWSGDKFAVFSPENMPITDFFNDLAEMFIGKTSDPFYGNLQMSEEEYKEALEFINKHFFVIMPEADFTLESLMQRVKFLVRKQGITHWIIDPYNTVEHLTKGGETIDLYISRFLGKLKRFAVEQDIGIHLVAHQLTAKRNKEDGNRYHKPDLNTIKGGGTFADKADNVIFVWRPERANDFRNPDVVFASQKIKKQKLVARPGEVWDIRFEFKENRYYYSGICPLHAIDTERERRKNPDFVPIEVEKPTVKNYYEAFDKNENKEDELPF